MKKRHQAISRYSAEYRTLPKPIKKCRQAKEDRLNERRAQIERITIIDMADIHKNERNNKTNKRMHIIKRGNADKRERKTSSKIEQILSENSSTTKERNLQYIKLWKDHPY